MMYLPAMIAQRLTQRLEHFGKSLPTLIQGLELEDLRWKPPSGNWSILEVLCHLADEEAEDFRARLAFVLERRTGEWPRIDPEGARARRPCHR